MLGAKNDTSGFTRRNVFGTHAKRVFSAAVQQILSARIKANKSLAGTFN